MSMQVSPEEGSPPGSLREVRLSTPEDTIPRTVLYTYTSGLGSPGSKTGGTVGDDIEMHPWKIIYLIETLDPDLDIHSRILRS